MAININDFVKNAEMLKNKDTSFKTEENYFYVYPYGDKFNNTFFMFNFIDEKSISEKGVYIYNDAAFNVIIEQFNERFYLSVKEKIDYNKIDITKKCNKITNEQIKERLIKCIKILSEIADDL